MNLEVLDDTKEFPQIVVLRNAFDEEDLNEIWKELDFLDGKLHPPKMTGTAATSDGRPKKKNFGLFLSQVYNNDPIHNTSNILPRMKKLYSGQVLDELKKKYSHFHMFDNECIISTLLTYYGSGDYYLPHKDHAGLTILAYFYKEPKSFTGGDLVLNDFDVTIPIENNMVMYMPSHYTHEVTPVEMEYKKGYGRYCVSQFVLRKLI